MARAGDLVFRGGALYHPDGRKVQPGELRGGVVQRERDFEVVEAEPQGDDDGRQMGLFEEDK